MNSSVKPCVQPGTSGVTINISNPAVNVGGQCPMQQPAQQPVQPQPQIQQPAATNLNNSNQPSPPVPPENKKTEPKNPIVMLTDDYIKLLDQYMNDKNADKRLRGAKELLMRFKEDPSRRNEPALTNLLNRALQDPSQTVRLIGLCILKGNYAAGNDLTLQLLQKMQKSDSVYNQDAEAATDILLDKAGQNLNVQSKSDNTQQNSATHPAAANALQQTANTSANSGMQPTDTQTKPTTGQNLNVVSK